jgi:hypothetical protein
MQRRSVTVFLTNPIDPTWLTFGRSGVEVVLG